MAESLKDTQQIVIKLQNNIIIIIIINNLRLWWSRCNRWL